MNSPRMCPACGQAVIETPDMHETCGCDPRDTGMSTPDPRPDQAADLLTWLEGMEGDTITPKLLSMARMVLCIDQPGQSSTADTSDAAAEDPYTDALREVAAALRSAGLYPEGVEPETAADVVAHVRAAAPSVAADDAARAPASVFLRPQRLPLQEARTIVHAFLWEEFFGDSATVSMCEDGEHGWSFCVHEDDPASRVTAQGVDWLGTEFDPVRQWYSQQDRDEDIEGIMAWQKAGRPGMYGKPIGAAPMPEGARWTSATHLSEATWRDLDGRECVCNVENGRLVAKVREDASVRWRDIYPPASIALAVLARAEGGHDGE